VGLCRFEELRFFLESGSFYRVWGRLIKVGPFYQGLSVFKLQVILLGFGSLFFGFGSWFLRFEMLFDCCDISLGLEIGFLGFGSFI
jgi:hypothetical protein